MRYKTPAAPGSTPYKAMLSIFPKRRQAKPLMIYLITVIVSLYKFIIYKDLSEINDWRNLYCQ